jgi:predicted nucleic acid-binding Zn ribbon protein
MPVYVYLCEENGQTVEVRHGLDRDLGTWGEVCYAAQIPLGNTDFLASVRKVLTPPGIAVPKGNAEIRNMGFTKLVKRDDGVYENVTRSGGEARYMRRGEADSLPHLNKKIGD